ncbi:CsgG/HfaB family protein [Synechococcus sp. UW140]|uniref:CsgG/HfaB family protein n=1 Tax=Synechococcus sp. UW140 TaxID=368503 RepID=UPI002600CE9C|nr:CsgG/HfaB family protein [Synechococcus sp. UW140]
MQFTRLIPFSAVLAIGIGTVSPLLIKAQTLPISGNSRSINKPTVSVPEFKNNVSSAWWWQGPVAQDMAHALANELQGTGELKIVERQSLGQVLSEQELASLGIVKKAPTAAKKGQMTGAQYIILGTVTSFETNTDVKSEGSGMRFMGFGGSSQTTTTNDYVAIDVRVVNSTTGEIVGARTVEGRSTNSIEQKQRSGSLLPVAGLVAGFVPGLGSAGYAATAAASTLNFDSNSNTESRTPVAKAIRAALISASNYVSCLLAPQGNCMAEFESQDKERRAKTLGTLKLE